VAKKGKTRAGGVRPGLVAVLIVLTLLVAAFFLFLVWATRPIGAPVASADLGGLTWVRSIYGYGEAPEQQFSGPTDVAVAPDGTIWAADPGYQRVLAFTPDGQSAGVIQPTGGEDDFHFVQPEGVGVGPDGHVFVAEFGLGRIFEFSPLGTFVQEWEVPSFAKRLIRGDGETGD
jgi:streptogramin lyase